MNSDQEKEDIKEEIQEEKIEEENTKKKDIYTYTAPWTIYGLGWSRNPFRLGICSFIEEYKNQVQVIELNEKTQEFDVVAQFDHNYPATKILFSPDENVQDKELIATTGDYLRIWGLENNEIELKCILKNKNSMYCAPLTSFDWNETNKNMIGTSSIDTTCTMWDLEKETSITQIIAHDKEVYDIAFRKGESEFASVGADGSVRMFDLRNLEHSTIMYESPNLVSLLRLGWNKQDQNYLATFSIDSEQIVILDTRRPSIPVSILDGHVANVNALAWAPNSSCHICSAGDDSQALIWDLSKMPEPIEDPFLGYQAESEINQLQWSPTQHHWISIAFSNKLQILRV
ncbi:wd repeat containing protein [Anaeramoeba flamelloides]|uniref:Wd repeat containing protein n=1 Tax=Anaeramoeba flamelloides TaxID=1746091 RepID=A0AAV7YKL2_9EUKA|nr:wd repeat containing protein [Anaeramoeba flamelloides]KAJ6238514.1 wd repeat containing protein [Anaeramoeba flamelloides]